jgi:hypothetical protein
LLLLQKKERKGVGRKETKGKYYLRKTQSQATGRSEKTGELL